MDNVGALMEKFNYKCSMQVRDYEIGMQGGVHHSTYVQYLEHCRNTYVRNIGIDVYQYHLVGYGFVIVHLSLDYKLSLFPNDKFYVTARMSREGKLRIIFDQEIRRESDNALVLTAKVVSICLNNKTGKPCMPEMLDTILETIQNE